MAKNKRFKVIHTEGALSSITIYVDTETGVNYLFTKSGYAGGLTPLLDRQGKPVISPISKY